MQKSNERENSYLNNEKPISNKAICVGANDWNQWVFISEALFILMFVLLHKKITSMGPWHHLNSVFFLINPLYTLSQWNDLNPSPDSDKKEGKRKTSENNWSDAGKQSERWDLPPNQTSCTVHLLRFSARRVNFIRAVRRIDLLIFMNDHSRLSKTLHKKCSFNGFAW